MVRICMLLMVAGIVAAGLQASGQERRAEPTTAAVSTAKLNPVMVRVCALSDEQQQKIAGFIAQREEAVKAFRKANEEKLQDTQKAARKAAQSGDEDAMEKAQARRKALLAEVDAIFRKEVKQTLDVMTAEQKAKWFEHTAMEFVQARYEKARLTEDQMTKIRAAYAESVKGKDLEDDKVNADVMLDFRVRIDATILTPEQRLVVKYAGVRGHDAMRE